MNGKVTEENYENLANAIVEQAWRDYISDSIRMRELVVKILNGVSKQDMDDISKKLMTLASDKKGIRRFFHSQWFRELTSVDGEYLLIQLKQRVKDYDHAGLFEADQIA